MNSRKNQLRMIRSLVDNAADILLDPKTPLRELAGSASCSQIDDIYEAGRDAGAVGGKLLGAGGGGFMVLLVAKKTRPGPRAAAQADPFQCRFRY
jgi:D-glycero-alpha-D-manno-heptose-7-phosphate kinase